MKIPFLNLFRKGKDAAPDAPAPALAKVAPAATTSGEKTTGAARLSKTVMPNAPRNLPAAHTFQAATAPSSAAAVLDALAPVARPKINFETPATDRSKGNGERLISLAVGDLIDRLPATMLNTGNIAPNRRLSFKASEIERGMSAGRPSTSLQSIYDQAPELFSRPVAASDPKEVLLPVTKIIEQFTQFQVRADQIAEDAVPQVETPFLKVTLEDNKRFGIETPEITVAALPQVRLDHPGADEPSAAQPATASTMSAAQPEPAPKERVAPIRIELPAVDTKPPGSTPATPIQLIVPEPAAPMPPPIAFSFSPKGTDAPATETVPASAEPSVPTSLPAPVAAAPVRIPFKFAGPSEAVAPLPERVAAPAPRVRRTTGSPRVARPGAQEISLSLRAIMQSLPAFQLNGDPDDVPDDVRITLPFALIEPQLVLGRVAIAPAVFEAAIPEDFRDIFDANEASTPVALPLQEILQNLPGSSLQLREDQEEQEIGQAFETAFSQKAQEDAERFNIPAAPVTKQVSLSAEDYAVAEDEPEVAAEELDAKTVVAQTAALSDIAACAILFSDGLSLAGNFPPELKAEGLCAMAPSLLKRVNDYTAETRLGSTAAITLFCGTSPVSFFMHDNICLAALHASGDLAPATRTQLARAVRGLARKYPQAA